MVHINPWSRELKESGWSSTEYIEGIIWGPIGLRRLVKNGEEQPEHSRGGRISRATWEWSSLCTTLWGLRKHNTGFMCSSYSECKKIIRTFAARVSTISSASIRQPSVLAELWRRVIHFQCGQCASACRNPTFLPKCACQPPCKVSSICSRESILVAVLYAPATLCIVFCSEF